MYKIMISAGEASGDMHAAGVLAALQQRGLALSCFGMGGQALEASGLRLDVDSRELSFIGFVDVLRNYPKLKRSLNHLRHCMQREKPDLLLSVDYPGFNLKLAATAQEMGIPVLHYVSPQVWAWREGRIKTIAKVVNHIAVLFPFEEQLYHRHGVPATYVGHPLLDQVHDTTSAFEAREKLGLDQNALWVGLMPGSRNGELIRNLPVMLAAAQRLKKNNPDVRFLLPLAPSLDNGILDKFEAIKALPVTIVKDHSHLASKACECVAVASGTATLELALLGIPMVVVYKLNPINFAIMRRLIKIPYISLVNIVAEKPVCKELIQDAATAERISDELALLVSPSDYRKQLTDNLHMIKQRMGAPGASERVASLVIDMLPKPTTEN